MRFTLPILCTALLAAGALVAPPPDQGVDYAALPPEPSLVHDSLAKQPTSLTRACELAEKAAGGLANLARVLPGEPALARIEVYTASEHRTLEVRLADGTIASDKPVPRFPGVEVKGEPKTTPSGLQYWELREGNGETPSSPSTVVRVHYTGWLNDGTEFDSSRKKGAPLERACNRLMAGWTEALLTMKVGGQRKLIVPPSLAYGKQGYPGAIPPNATLIFDMELVEIVPTPGAPPQKPPAPKEPPK